MDETQNDTPTKSHLLARRRDLTIEADALRDTRSAQDKRLGAIQKELHQIEVEMKAIPGLALKVSDHALLRYIERNLNVDLDELRKLLMPTDGPTVAAIQKLGNGTYPVGTSHRIIVKEETIVTVLPIQ